MQQDCVGIPALRSESGTLSDPKEKAEILNNYFKSVFKTDAPNDTLPTLAPKDIPAIGNICVTVNGIVKQLNLLKPNKACGPDKVSARILKLAPEETAVILREIFQQSLDSGEVPCDWKHAMVAPIHKRDSRSSPTNYRPISLTCISYKLLEHIVASHIMKTFGYVRPFIPFPARF